jgi:hypothetical protein
MSKFFKALTWLFIVVIVVLLVGVHLGKIKFRTDVLGYALHNVLWVKLAAAVLLLFIVNRLSGVVKFITGLVMVALLAYLLYDVVQVS